MASWVRIDDDIVDHYKTKNIARILKCSRAEAIGYNVMLIIYVKRVAWRTGDLSAYGDEDIEEACKWKGEPGDLVSAFRKCGKVTEDGTLGSGILDGFVLHNWVNKSSKLIRDRLYREGLRGKKPGEEREATPDEKQVLAIWNAHASERRLPAAVAAPVLPDGVSPATFELLLSEASKYPFLYGETEMQFRMNLGWILLAKNREKIMNGFYAKRDGTAAVEADPGNYRETTRKILASRADFKRKHGLPE